MPILYWQDEFPGIAPTSLAMPSALTFPQTAALTLTATVGGAATHDGINGDIFIIGETVAITALPDEGYIFVEWQDENGEAVSADAVYSFTVSGNMTLTAVFAFNTQTPLTAVLTLGATDGGAAIHDGANGDIFGIGETVTITAATDEGYIFVEWRNENGDTVSTDAVYSFTVAGDITMTAVFAFNTQTPPTAALTLGATDGGAAAHDGANGDIFGIGDTVTITALPDEGYIFVEWRNENGEAVSTDAIYSFTISGDITLTAIFAEENAYDETGNSTTDDNSSAQENTAKLPEKEDEPVSIEETGGEKEA